MSNCKQKETIYSSEPRGQFVQPVTWSPNAAINRRVQVCHLISVSFVLISLSTDLDTESQQLKHGEKSSWQVENTLLGENVDNLMDTGRKASKEFDQAESLETSSGQTQLIKNSFKKSKG